MIAKSRCNLIIHKDDINTEKLYLPNPEYLQAKTLGHSTRLIDEKIPIFKESGDYILLPRQIGGRFLDRSKYQIIDETVEGTKVEFTESITPREHQIEPWVQLSKSDNIILKAACGAGKTVIACKALAHVGVTTLIIVHTTALYNQWQERIKEFLGEDVGLVRSAKCQYKGKKIVVALLQSLIAREYPQEFYDYFGVVITDETHRIGALNWSEAIQKFPAKKRWGLTATPTRSDGLHELVYAHISSEMIEVQYEPMKPRVYQIQTGVHIPDEDLDSRWDNPKYGAYLKSQKVFPRPNVARLVSYLAKSSSRNKFIISYLKDAAKQGRKILVTSERVEHLETLFQMMGEEFKCSLYLGKSKVKERKEAEEAQIIFGSSSITKEGLDIPDLSVLVMATPISNENMIIQMCGRALRMVEDKKTPVVVDFVDNIGIAQGMAGKRRRIYTEQGYTLK